MKIEIISPENNLSILSFMQIETEDFGLGYLSVTINSLLDAEIIKRFMIANNYPKKQIYDFIREYEDRRPRY